MIATPTGQKPRVVVAMSGGVDSSVAAALLVKAGYQVIGMMLRLWSERGKEESNRCCTPDAMAQARRVAAILDIPFYVIDARQIFYNTVVNYFIDGYTHSETPNPCLVCNKHIRWGYLLEHALAMDAQYMATGHYVRLSRDNQGLIQVLTAVDLAKDQSYVLHILDQEQLAHAMFPIGDYPKSEIRQIAQKVGLPVAQRPDSQDLCFLGNEDYRLFLVRHAPNSSLTGPILTRSGEQIGEHAGLAFYTIGQRKGLGIASAVPLYVIDKDQTRNALIVGKQEELGKSELWADNVNWVSGRHPKTAFRAQVKIRYKASAVNGTITPQGNDRFHAQFDQAMRDITPGQAAVVYDGDYCLGGGLITSYR